MLSRLLILSMLVQAVASAPSTGHPATGAIPPGRSAGASPTNLIKVRAIYVDSFGDDAASKQLQSMIISSLTAAKRFKVTENPARADAVLRGVALEETAQEQHSYSESTAVRSAAISDSASHTVNVSNAKLSVRLVSPDGDVIWSTTQESKGGKYKGAAADVADNCVKQLLRDIAKLEKGTTSSALPETPSK